MRFFSAQSPAVPILFAALVSFALCSEVAAEEKYRRSVDPYTVPEVTLIDHRGGEVFLPRLFDSERPVLLDFIYATCTTVCPVLSAGFSNFQKKLGPEAEGVVLVSVSIDPEHDTPEIMARYLDRYRAREGWSFLTGRGEDIDKVMRAFDAYVSNKMSHKPLTFLRTPGTGEWVRLDGLMGTSDLIEEFRRLDGGTAKSP